MFSPAVPEKKVLTILAVDFLKFKIKESKMTILLIFSTILLKTITFLVICYLLAKTSMLERELEKLKIEKKFKKESKNEKNID